VLSRRVAWSVALAAVLTMTVSIFDRQTLSVLAPSVTKAMGISESAYGWLTASFSAAYLFATPLGGRWIDRVGARRGLVYSVLAWSAVAALHAVAPGFGVLLVLRIALGVAEGPSFPGAAQTMLRALPPADRSRGFGVLFAGSSVGAMIAPPLASCLFRLAGWRVAFLGTACAGLIWVPLWIAVTGRTAVAAKLDVKAPVVASAPPPSFLQLVSHPIMIRALIGIAAAAPIVGFMTAWGAKFLVRRFGISQGDVGGYLWLPPVAFDVVAILFGDLAARQRRAPGAPPRALFAVASVLAVTLAVIPRAGTPWEAIAVGALSLGGAAAMYTLVTADMLGRMPAESVSFAGGIVAGAQSLALIISSPLVGRAVDHFGDYDVVALALGGWVIPGALIWWLWRPDERWSPRSV
jgi:ACS family hexuronate transporter-like MFS transporter